MIEDLIQYPFLQRAMLASVLASITCGIIGSLVIAKRLTSFSGGLAHAVFGGIGLAHYFNFSPWYGAFGFSVICSALMSMAYRWGERTVEILISIIWSLGMAIGIIFIAMTPRYAPDLNSYLFGSILLVSSDYLVFVCALDVLIVLLVAVFYKPLLCFCYDEEYTEISGYPAGTIFFIMLLLTSLAVLTLIKVVGIILTIALLTLPAAVARQWSGGLTKMMALSTLLSAVFMVLGLYLSYTLAENFGLNMPSGPVIIVLLSLGYIGSSLVKLLQHQN